MVRPRRQNGFSLVEVLIALAISVVLLLATMMALRSSFETYRRTAESVSTNVSGRLIVERLQMMIRGGVDFLPLPIGMNNSVDSDTISIQAANGTWTTVRWDAATDTIRWEQGADSWSMLEGVTQLVGGAGAPVSPFRMRFRDGRWMTHATVDLVVDGNGVTSTDLDLADVPEMRFVGSAMPRRVAWGE
ncbi:MAG: prepilin-type N-terminal cleavage/methylation domain-containing protein [Planctomycetes bacterium]|nr:prepilin-type N-terminal cleavage/methylation domain-containing protein [Planctomycetota bacterium]MCP4838263.1 prepilin-type N-terminal cleavage/methylation domain-containing protein [Planctomycetota bacterium]